MSEGSRELEARGRQRKTEILKKKKLETLCAQDIIYFTSNTVIKEQKD